MFPGMSRPRRNYVSGRSKGTGFTGTRSHISTAASKTTWRGRRGGMTLRSCHRGATTRRVGRSADGSSGRWGVAMQGVRDRRWNSERFIVFQTVILQRACHVTTSHAIRRRDAYPGSCEPIRRLPPGDVSHPGLGRTRAHRRLKPPPLLYPPSRRRPPSSSRYLQYLVTVVSSGHSVVPGRLRLTPCVQPSPIPLFAPWRPLPFPAPVASPPSASPLRPLVPSASSAALPAWSGAGKGSSLQGANRGIKEG